jgi:LacI family transcriptional regulator
MITIKDIAKATGYGMATVSKALNDYADISSKTKKIIKDKAKELNYIPNNMGRTLVTKQSFTIGVIFEETSDYGIAHPFFSEVLARIKTNLERCNYDILLIGKKVGEYVRTYLEHCIQKGVDGIIIVSKIWDKSNYNQLVESSIPMVFIDHDEINKNCVYTDSYTSIYDAVKYLYQKGHRDIAYLGGELDQIVGKERYEGYSKAVEDLNLTIYPRWNLYAEKYSFDNAYKTVDKLLSSGGHIPTSILCSGDVMAIGAMKAIQKNGLKVPDDISIIGFDNIRMSALISPALTTISQNFEQLAVNACELLLNQIKNPTSSTRKIIVASVLIERETVKDINIGKKD